MVKKFLFSDRAQYIIDLFFSFALGMSVSFGSGVFGISIIGVNVSIYRIVFLAYSTVFFIKWFLFSKKMKKPPLLSMLLFISFVYSLVLLIFTKDINNSLRSIVTLFFAFVGSIVYFCEFNKKHRFKMFVFFFLIGTFANYLICIYEMATRNYIIPSDFTKAIIQFNEKNIYGTLEPVGLFGNLNDFAMYCSFSLFLAGVGFFASKDKPLKLYFAFMSLFSFAMSFSTNSRASHFGSIAMIFIFCVMLALKRSNYKKIFVISSFISAFFFIVVYSMISKNMSDSIRTALYLNTISAVFEYTFCFGAGPGQAQFYLQRYANTNGVVAPHWFIAELFINFGVFLFALFVLFYFNEVFGFCKKDNERKTLSNISISFLISMIILTFGPSGTFDVDWVWVVFIIVHFLNHGDEPDLFSTLSKKGAIIKYEITI